MKRFVLGAGLFLAGLAIGFTVAVVWTQGRGRTGLPAASDAPVKILTFSAQIDGSDRFVFTPEAVTHEHGQWGQPRNAYFNGDSWTDLSQSPAGWVELARELNLQGATLVGRKGRDLIVLEPTPEGFALNFADTQMGAGPYVATISIPRR